MSRLRFANVIRIFDVTITFSVPRNTSDVLSTDEGDEGLHYEYNSHL